MSIRQDLAKAKALLDAGEVVGLPTETVYGLAARIDLPQAVEKIFITKERPFFDPLIVHVHSVEQARSLTSHWGLVAESLAQKFWPGPLTLILPKAAQVNSLITSGLESVGLRLPQHPVALELLKQVGVPLAAPSANKFGRTSPTSADHVRSEFSKENIFVLDGGNCQVGIESTVLLVKETVSGNELSVLRRGHVLQSEIERHLKHENMSFRFVDVTSKKESPGHMKHHYMPAIPLVISTSSQPAEELLVEINRRLREMPDEIESIKIVKPTQGIRSAVVLTLADDPVLAARELYSRLREAAAQGADCILFYRGPQHFSERWESLFDRMNKAASLIL